MADGETLVCSNCGNSMERGEQFWTAVRRDGGAEHVCGTCLESSCRYWFRLHALIHTNWVKALGIWSKS